MVTINVETVPANKGEKQIVEKVLKLVEDRNISIAKNFSENPKDVNVKLFYSASSLRVKLDPNGEGMGVFAGYIDGSDEILIVHPDSVNGLFTDLWKEMSVIIDYSLVKLYLCKKYYPKREDFKMYYKYVSEILAQVVSGKFKEDIAKFDMKTYFEGKKYKKEQELGIVLYLMREYSGTQFIFEHLDKIMRDCDIKKTIFSIYKKSFSELIKPEHEKLLEEEKKLRQKFKTKKPFKNR